MEMYGDSLDMLPDHDVTVSKPKLTGFLTDLRKDPIRWRATLYGYIACFCQGSEFSTFAFYIPVLFVSLGSVPFWGPIWSPWRSSPLPGSPAWSGR